MANTETLGASFAIDTTNLKAGLAQANRLIRESNSEFKAAAAGMDDWSESEEGLTARLKNLNTVADLQSKKVDALQSEYDRLISEGLDPTSAAAIKLRTDINKEKEALAKTQKEIKDSSEALENLADASDEAADGQDEVADSAKKAGKGLSALKKAGGVAVGAIAAVGAAAAGLVTAFLSTAESTREVRENMTRLETSFESAGFSAEKATETYNDLYGILGDTGRATEAAQQLTKLSKTEDDLKANTRILTGVLAEYGDSIPTEGLAEGMAATAAMGNVQGVLADALEWQGVNLDKYNEKLEKMKTEEQRAAYIQQTLIDLYGESADAFAENNKAIIEAREAEAALSQATAELGAIAEPIMTRLKQIATDLLITIQPFVKLIGEGLTGALDGAADAGQKLADGISGVLNTVIGKVTEALPMVLSVITGIIPSVLKALTDAVPEILQAIIDIVPQITDALLNAIPLLLDCLAEIVAQLLISLGTLLPQILQQIIAILPKVIESLINAIPLLLDAATQFLMAIVEAIPTIITQLLHELPKIINTIINGVVKAVPQLLQAAITLLMAIIQAIPTIIQALIENLPTIINTIIDGVLNALPLLLEAAIQFFMAIIDAIPTIIDALVTNLPKIITTIVKVLVNNLPKIIQAAVQLFMGLIKAIPQICKELIKNMPQIISSIVSGLKKGFKDIVNVGKDLIRGLWDGINDMVGWIGKKVKGFGENVLGGLKDFFGIKSPSKVMANVVGKNLALGIGEGFEDNIKGVNADIEASMNPITKTNASTAIAGAESVSGGGSVVVYQTNNYAQAHSRFELYKSKQETVAAVRLAMGTV
jgi:phage-related protein/uncharacterized protein YoxC